jgi:sugar phosphate isomerase/epimerase
MSIQFSRRHLLASLPGALAAAQSKSKMSRIQLGCQTNAWPIDPKNLATFLGVLEKVRGYGFHGFETSFVNLQDHFAQAAAVKPQIDKTGLRFFGIHIFLLQYDPKTLIAPEDLYRRIADGGAQLGAERLILSGRSAAPNGIVDQELLKRKTDAMNAAAKYARRKGLGFVYHNHEADFAGDGAEIGALMRGTDPSLVRFLFDAGHAYLAKVDVTEFFKKHRARISAMHVRDFQGDQQVPLGQGTFPLTALAAAVEKARWRGWVLAEEERLAGVKPGDSAVAPARQALRKAFGE